jgi:hypothetical protein
MSVIATEVHVKGNVVKEELWADLGYCRTVVTVNDTAGTLAVGTVLGKVTAGGKYKRAVETAVDGSKVADAIVIAPITILGATDTKVLCFTRGPSAVSKSALVLDATYNDATKLGAVYTSLEAKGIQVLDTI